MLLLLAVLAYRAWKTTRTHTAAPRGHVPARRGLARVVVYTGVLATALGGLGAHRAHAAVGSAALDLGRELGAVAPQDTGSATVRLNGESFHVAETSSDEPVSDVLDVYERACRERPGALAELFHTLPTKGTVQGKPYELPDTFAHGVVRNGTAREGVVMCLLGDPASRRGLAAALGAFAASQDLGDLGEVRYAYARRERGESGGGRERTKVTLAWTDAHFDLKKITAGGEGAGTEGRVPRPEGARRMLTAEVVGAPHATRIYETSAPVGAVVTHYDHALLGAGFRRMTPRSEAHVLRAYFSESLHVFVAVRREGERTVFAVTESAGETRATSSSTAQAEVGQ